MTLLTITWCKSLLFALAWSLTSHTAYFLFDKKSLVDSMCTCENMARSIPCAHRGSALYTLMYEQQNKSLKPDISRSVEQRKHIKIPDPTFEGGWKKPKSSWLFLLAINIAGSSFAILWHVLIFVYLLATLNLSYVFFLHLENWVPSVVLTEKWNWWNFIGPTTTPATNLPFSNASALDE